MLAQVLSILTVRPCETNIFVVSDAVTDADLPCNVSARCAKLHVMEPRKQLGIYVNVSVDTLKCHMIRKFLVYLGFGRLFNKLFLPCHKLGYNVTYNNVSSPIPDLRELDDDLWLKRSELVAIDINEENQIELLSRFTSLYVRANMTLFQETGL